MEAATVQRYARLSKDDLHRRDNDQQQQQLSPRAEKTTPDRKPTSPADAHPAEHVVVMEEDDGDGDENSSLMEEATNVDSIFRKFKDRPQDGTQANSTASTAASTHRPISPIHINSLVSRSHSTSFDLDDDWDEDEAGLSRYHRGDLSSSADPLPAEFTHDSFPKRMWQSFLELRLAARQRRAARLLTIPSESSWKYKARSCFLTWCCDATDSGILLAGCVSGFWFMMGWMFSMGTAWWFFGLVFFIIRVTARRAYESWQGHRRRLRQRLSTTEITNHNGTHEDGTLSATATGGLWRESSNTSSTDNFQVV